MTTTPDKLVWIIEEELSDGSKVYNVEIEGEEYHCATENDAYTFAEEFVALINKHTNETAGVMYP